MPKNTKITGTETRIIESLKKQKKRYQKAYPKSMG
jgi:hypothetical protein